MITDLVKTIKNGPVSEIKNILWDNWLPNLLFQSVYFFAFPPAILFLWTFENCIEF